MNYIDYFDGLNPGQVCVVRSKQEPDVGVQFCKNLLMEEQKVNDPNPLYELEQDVALHN